MIEVAETRALVALLEWQIELGADEAILDAPQDRYALAEPAPKAAARPKPEPTPEPLVLDPVAEAEAAASRADSLEALAAAMAAYPHCELHKGARNFVFCDGRPEARVMIVGEAPGREEDLQGRPFVGRAGQLLDRMFAAIGLGRDRPDPESLLYITNVLPWHPPANRAPTPAEIAMLLPFLKRHIALAQPDVLVLVGNTPCQALLGRAGITRIRGKWTEALGRPVLPTFHPAYLLRNPAAKREVWADLLEIRARLEMRP